MKTPCFACVSSPFGVSKTKRAEVATNELSALSDQHLSQQEDQTLNLHSLRAPDAQGGSI